MTRALPMSIWLIVPAATAYLLVRDVKSMMALASLLAAFAGVAGLYLSYYARIASGVSLAASKPIVTTSKLSSPSTSRAAATASSRCCVVVGHT